MGSKLALLVAALWLVGCGYVGDPLPPALNIPLAVTDLKTGQRGGTVYVDFTIPSLTTEQLGIRQLADVELRLGTGGEPPFDVARWSGSAKLYPVEHRTPGVVHVEIPASEWVGKEVIAAVRLGNSRGRYSGWSNLSVVHVLPPLNPPDQLVVQSYPEGVRLSWSPFPGAQYRVYRSGEGDKAPVLLSTVSANEFIDRTITLGKPYRYSVQTTVKSVESGRSNAVSIVPEDKFAPAVPTGLTAIAGIDTVELSWERNTEPDLQSYRVYRSEEAGGWERLTPDAESPAWSDKTAKGNKLYRYAVSAVDAAGNESARSSPAEIRVTGQ